MPSKRLTGLKLMLTGLAAPASREVICSLLSAGAEVMGVGDEIDLHRLQRDLGLYGLAIRALPIDLSLATDVRLFAENLQSRHDLPHMIICCCAGGDQCRSSVLSTHLSPPLFLHLITRDCARVVERLLDVGTHDLQSIIRRRLIFGGSTPIRRAMIGRNAFALEEVRGRGYPTARRPSTKPKRSSRHGRSRQFVPAGDSQPRVEIME